MEGYCDNSSSTGRVEMSWPFAVRLKPPLERLLYADHVVLDSRLRELYAAADLP